MVSLPIFRGLLGTYNKTVYNMQPQNYLFFNPAYSVSNSFVHAEYSPREKITHLASFKSFMNTVRPPSVWVQSFLGLIYVICLYSYFPTKNTVALTKLCIAGDSSIMRRSCVLNLKMLNHRHSQPAQCLN